MKKLSLVLSDLRAALRLVSAADLRPIWFGLMSVLPLSLALAYSGADAAANRLAQEAMPFWSSILWSAPPMILGMAVPLLVPLAASLWSRPMAARLWAAFGLSLVLVSTLKALTGRVHPEASLPADLFERSISFALFSGEVMEGWPSGHAATNGAVALTLALIAPRFSRLALVWAVWVWAAVVFGINGQVHWLSDMAAGAVIALAVTLSLHQGKPHFESSDPP